MPGMRPEPFYGTNVQSSVDTSVNNINTNDDDYNESEALYSETPSHTTSHTPSHTPLHNPSLTSPKRRPPAPFIVGKPQRQPSIHL